MKRIVLGLLLGFLLVGCAPRERSLTRTFDENFAKIEQLRTGLCATWRNGGTIMLDAWEYPALPPTDLKRYRDILRSIGATHISVDRDCHAYIAMWQGTVVDLSKSKFIRQEDIGFQFGPMKEALSDAKTLHRPMMHGWMLVRHSYTWVS